MQLFKGKIVHAEDKISKNGNNYQLIYLLVEDEVLTIFNWKTNKLSKDENVKLLVQIKKNFKSIFKILKK